MPAIAAHDQVGAYLHGRFPRATSDDPCYAIAVPGQLDGFVPHAQVESRKSLRLFGEKIEEVPLRHQCDELAVGRHVPEVGSLEWEVSEDAANTNHLLVRDLQKLLEQPKLVQHFESGGMHGVTAEITEEVAMLFEDGNVYTRTSEQIPRLDARRAPDLQPHSSPFSEERRWSYAICLLLLCCSRGFVPTNVR